MQSVERTSGSGRLCRRVLAVALIMGFVAAACGSGEASTASEATVPDASPAAEQPLVDEFATLDGTTIDLATLQGKDVVLWFWAPW